MEVINDIIRHMDKHAAKQYKVFAKRNLEEMERKDLKLFDMIRKGGDDFDEEKALLKLYGSTGKNAYYRLKNRLAEDVGMSIFLQNYQNNEQMLCHYFVSLGYFYHARNNYRIAFYFFRRAEKKAKSHENYGLLDIIYSQMIKLAREIGSINPETYIKRRKENRQILNALSEVEDILEAFEYRVKISQNLSQAGPNLTELLSRTLEEYTGNEDLRQSPKVLFGTYFIISRTLLQQKKYDELEEYLVSVYNSFVSQQLFNKTNHQQKLQMLAWIANAAFKNKHFGLSLEYAEKLREEMELFDRLHYAPYEFYYYNVLVINYSAINPKKAIEVLLQMANKEQVEKHAYNGVFIYFNLALLYFQQRDYKKAISYLNKLYQHWGYESMDANTKLSALTGELMMRYELKEYDFLEYRLKQILKENKSLLSDESMALYADFLKVYGEMLQAQGRPGKKENRATIRQFLEKYQGHAQEENNLFGYNTWLNEKAK